jgi:hypothetical protein
MQDSCDHGELLGSGSSVGDNGEGARRQSAAARCSGSGG